MAPSLALALKTGTPVALLAVGFLAPARFHPFSVLLINIHVFKTY